jgi:hypothetical protein
MFIDSKQNAGLYICGLNCVMSIFAGPEENTD